MDSQFSMSTSSKEKVKISLPELFSKSKYTVLYFYPRDNTPGCSIESKAFADITPKFESLGAQVVGVSKDGHKSHCSFIDTQGLNFGLISDPEKIIHKYYGVLGKKTLYGKIYDATLRNTFLIDQDGKILHKRIEVEPESHAKEVYQKLLEISKNIG